MRNQIYRISDLKKKAKNDVASHVERWNNAKKVINMVIGTAATNRDWLSTAYRHYNTSTSYYGLERLNYLVSSLFNIYRCEFRMESSRMKDESVYSLKEKVESSYFNTILDFLEETIHDESRRTNHLADIQQAIAALAEMNKRLATGYYNILNQFMQQEEVKDIVENMLNTPVEDITPTIAVRLKGILQLHEFSLRKNPKLLEHIVSFLRTKMEEVFLNTRKLYEQEEKKKEPSLHKLIAIVGDFETIYQPLRQYVYAKRYRDFINQKERYDAFMKFINEDYPELIQMYKYLSLPREINDTRKLISLYHKIRSFHHLVDSDYIEMKTLKPSLSDISERFEKALSNVYRRDLMDYYKIFNRMINVEDDDGKIEEMIAFYLHLSEKVDDDSISEYIKDKLSEMRSQIREDLDTFFERSLQDKLEAAQTDKHIIEAFDDILDFLMKIADIERIETFQQQKKKLINKLRELRKLQARLDQLDEGESGNTDLQRLVEQYEHAVNITTDFHTPELDEFRRTASRLKRSVSITEASEATQLRMVILDKFSLRNYVIFTQNTLRFGRNQDNDVILLSEWISGNHLEMDFTSGILKDLNSTNGTFVNGSDDRMTSEKLENVEYFNIAGEALFSLKHFQNSHFFRMQKVLDKKLMDDPDRREYVQSLMNTEFVRLSEGDTLSIHKVSGNIDESYQNLNEVILIKYEQGNFFFSDHLEGIIEKPVEYISDVLTERFSLNLS